MLKLWGASALPTGFVEIAGWPSLQFWIEWDPRICISNKFSCDADVAGMEITLWGLLLGSSRFS